MDGRTSCHPRVQDRISRPISPVARHQLRSPYPYHQEVVYRTCLHTYIGTVY